MIGTRLGPCEITARWHDGGIAERSSRPSRVEGIAARLRELARTTGAP